MGRKVLGSYSNKNQVAMIFIALVIVVSLVSLQYSYFGPESFRGPYIPFFSQPGQEIFLENKTMVDPIPAEELVKMESLREEVKEEVVSREEVRVIIRFKGDDQTIDVPENEFMEGSGTSTTKSGVISRGALAQISDDPNVDEVFLDQPVSLLTKESVGIINVPEAWDIGPKGVGTRICLIDTGVDYGVIRNYAGGYDFVNNDSDPWDDHGHGTRVASIIDDVAPSSELVVAKVIDSNGNGYESDVLKGLEYCEREGVDIISISIGAGSYSGFCDSNPVAEYVNELVGKGIIVIAATGNDGSTSIKSPSCASKAIRVASSDKSDAISGFSNVNYFTDVLAPGENIVVEGLEGEQVSASGTSLSVPFVSGLAALLIEHDSLTPEQIRYRLRSTGKPIPLFVNFTLTIDVPRIDALNAVEGVRTMIPYDYLGAGVPEGEDEFDEGEQVFETLATNWWDNNYGRCRNITISNAGTSTLTNFVAYINLSYSPDMQSDFDDIRFVNTWCDNGGSVLDFEKEKYVSSQYADFWVQIPSLPSSGTTISVYYDYSGASSGEDMTGTWDDGYYVFVHHLNETSNNHQDSTSNNLDGTFSGTTANMNSPGKIDGGDYFDGNNDYVYITESSSAFDWSGDFTLELWVKTTESCSTNNVYMSRDEDPGSGNSRFWIGCTDGDIGKTVLSVDDNNDNIAYTGSGETMINDGEWHHLVGLRTGNTIKVYVDGKYDETSASGLNSGMTDNDQTIHIGGYFYQPLTYDAQAYIDEARISDGIARSDDWINQSYQIIANHDDFVTIGSEMIKDDGVTLVSPENNEKVVEGVINFACKAVVNNVQNVSFWGDFSGSFKQESIDESVTSGEIVNFSKSLGNDTYVWNCKACNTTNCYFADSNFTVIVTDSWWDTGFAKCRNIEIKNAGSTTLKNFPAYINVSYVSGMETDFDDIRFIDTICDNGGELLDYETERVYASSSADNWVRIPSLPAAGINISMYYDKTGASSGESMYDTWDDYFVLVHHLEETVGTYDSTDYGHMTSNNGATPNSLGAVDGGYYFVPNDYLNVIEEPPGSFDFYSDFTLEAWINVGTCSGTRVYIGRAKSTGNSRFWLGCNGADSKGNFRMDDNTGTWDETGSGATSLNDNTWHHVVGTWDGSTGRLYVDGEYDGASFTTALGALTDNDNDPTIGNFMSAYYVTGYMDEIRVSNGIARSADWINQTYQMVANQANFVDIDDEYDQPVIITIVKPANATEGSDDFELQFSSNTLCAVYSVDAGSNVTNCSLTDYQWEGTFSGLGDGPHNLTVWANSSSLTNYLVRYWTRLVPCTSGTDCGTQDCIEGSCKDCSSSYNGQRCSDDSNSYTNDGICTLQTGTGWSCDETFAAYNTVWYLYQCSDSGADYGDTCDSNALAGGYVSNGVCGAASHSSCCTNFASGNTNQPDVCNTEFNVCNGYDGDYCDDVDDSSWDAGDSAGTNKFRCDDTDNTCISCDSNNKEQVTAPNTELNGDGACEYACGADSLCDEINSGAVNGNTCCLSACSSDTTFNADGVNWVDCNQLSQTGTDDFCYYDTGNACYYQSGDSCDTTNGWGDSGGANFDKDNCYDGGSVSNPGTSSARCYWTESCTSTGAATSCKDGQLVTSVVTCDSYANWVNGAGYCYYDNGGSAGSCHYNPSDLCADDADGWDHSTDTCYDSGTVTNGGTSSARCYFNESCDSNGG
ncbi:MAG: hypothetical protein JW754_05190, partial [Candidatus Aenigmarchaeota archaeon]|nr:hypothetical protein [Candidatus Aenigmarchaeota archaeon]